MKYFYKNKSIILILIFIYLFKDFFVPYYHKYIIDIVLVKFNQSLISDSLFALFTLFLFYIVFQKLKIRFFLSANYVIYSFLIILLYSVIRYTYKNQLVGFYSFEKAKYFDLLFIIGTIPIILKLGFWITEKDRQNVKSDFHDDNPIVIFPKNRNI